jgi:nitroreductase
MEFAEVVRRRRMVRSFDGRPVDRAIVEELLRTAQRGPSAGFSQGQAFVVLEGSAQTGPFWDLVADEGWPHHEGVRRAPVVVVPLSSKQAYLDRYSMPDKVAFGLGEEAAWPVPYWDVDTGMAVTLLLLAAVDKGLGALFVGIFRGEEEVLRRLGVPSEWRPIGAVALGHPEPDTKSQPSRSGGRRPFDEAVHWGRW